MNIYVGNLPRTTSEEAVRKLFEECGEVSEVKLVKDQYTGDLRGFGFVEMPSKSEALKAIQSINGSDLEGRTLAVNEARPRGERSSGGGGGGFSRGGSGGGGNRGSRPRSW